MYFGGKIFSRILSRVFFQVEKMLKIQPLKVNLELIGEFLFIALSALRG